MNFKFKPLNQENFDLEIIQDLGMVYATPKSKQKHRKAIFKCPICKTGFTTNVITVKNGNTTKCRSCSNGISNNGFKSTGFKINCHDKKIKNKIKNTYHNIKKRCYSKDSHNYKSYGGKGVTMCDEWLNDFNKFYNWSLKNGCDLSLTIDKDFLCDKLNIIPKIYSPETCMWVTIQENISFKKGCS